MIITIVGLGLDMPENPHIIVNVAQSLNGLISGSAGRRVTISSPNDLLRVHKIRSNVDAIIVGANTILTDNPRLIVDRNLVNSDNTPTRVVLDRNARCLPDSRVFDGSAPTILYTFMENASYPGAEVRVRDDPGLKLENILSELQTDGIRNILVEGGKRVITQFIEAGIIDEFYIFIGDVILEEDGISLFKSGIEIRDIIKKLEPMDRGILISLEPYHLQRSWRTQAKDT